MTRKSKIIAGFSAGVLVLGILVGVVFSMTSTEEQETKKRAPVTKKQTDDGADLSLCPLRGEGEQEDVSRPLAIIVENLSTIRPQAGVADACVVVEGLAEGGITRLMFVYGAHGSDNIGPVRSARSHFVALARGWDAIFGHVGGSPYAMEDIRNWGVKDWDQSSHSQSYERVRWTNAPHNVFTSTAKIRSAATQFQGGGDIDDRGFAFKKKPPLKSRPEGLKKITIDFSDPAYRVDYEYDRKTNTYKRFNGGQPFTDAGTKEQIAPANIVVMRAPTTGIPGGSGVLDVDVFGNGDLTVFQDGQVVDGTWEKEAPSSPLSLVDSEGDDIRLVPGQTWIEIVRPNTDVKIQQ